MTKNEKISERDIRIQKLNEIKSMWIIPYSQTFDKKNSIQEIIKIWDKESVEKMKTKSDIFLKNWTKNIYNTAWRMLSFRSHGKLSFAKLQDSTWTIQLCFVRDLIKLDMWNWKIVKNLTKSDKEEINIYKFLQKYIDVWDFIGVKWDLFITKHGEITLFVNELKLLSKAIRPLPEKFHWIQDQEKIYRQRYLDLIMNEDSYKKFVLRSKFLKVIRDFYFEKKFIEVETSILWNAASWAAAKPFITHHNDFDIDMYLRISPETALKKLTVWRFEKVFEVAKDFRNEGSDPSHIQEFTVIEHYAAFWNYEDNMKFTEQMFDYIFDKMPELKKKIIVKDKEWIWKEVDFTTPRQRIDYIEQIKKDSWIDVSKYKPEDEEKLRNLIKSKWFSREWLEIQTTATMIDYLYKKVTRPKIVGPAFIYNYPKTMQPLARVSDADSNIVEQRQLLVNWRELIKAYSELVDPLLQQANFDEQADALAKWDEEATSWDDEFVLAMEHGMPCQSWWGMWVDRIFAILTEQENIRDVVLFPLMKPENINKDNKNNLKKESDKNESLDWKKLFIFDFDGVIANSTNHYFKINKEKIWNTNNFEEYKNLFMWNIFKKLKWNKSKEDAKIELEKYFEEQEKIIDEIKLFDWIVDVLKELKNKWIIMDIVSSNRREFIKQLLKKYNLLYYFTNIYAEEDHYSKVDKIKSCLEKQNIDVENAVFITDTLWDILEANKVWIDTIAVDYWVHEKWRLEKGNPKFIVSNPKDILNCIFEQKTSKKGFLWKFEEVKKETIKLISQIKPFDWLEKRFIDDTIRRINSWKQIWRIEKPVNPPKHLVAYTIFLDQKKWKIFLVNHKDAWLILPPWWHIDEWELPFVSAIREIEEELWITNPIFLWDDKIPFFLSQSPTIWERWDHIDISLRYIFKWNSKEKIKWWIHFEKEFEWHKRYTFDEVLNLDMRKTDIYIHTLVKKLKKELENWKLKEIKYCNNDLINHQEKTSKKSFFSEEIVQKWEKLAEKYLTDTKKHCFQVGQIMKFFAKKLWEDENLRYVAWLLHDVDWDFVWKVADKHLQEDFDNIMEDLKSHFPNEDDFVQFKNDLKAHAHFMTWIQPETVMAKYLCSVDELSGLINAYSLMRPTWMEWMKAKSIKKKIKDKSFASWVDRNEVKNCEKMLWLDLWEFITDVIEAMQKSITN